MSVDVNNLPKSEDIENLSEKELKWMLEAWKKEKNNISDKMQNCTRTIDQIEEILELKSLSVLGDGVYSEKITGA